MLGLGDARVLRHEVAEARRAGVLICTTSGEGGGYFLPATHEEIAQWARTMQRKAASTFAALKAARRALEQVEGQMQLDSDLQEMGEAET